jgi:hypothetical protein
MEYYNHTFVAFKVKHISLAWEGKEIELAEAARFNGTSF